MRRENAMKFWEEAQQSGYSALSIKLIGHDAAILAFDPSLSNKETRRDMLGLVNIAAKHAVEIVYAGYGIRTLAFWDRDEYAKKLAEKIVNNHKEN
jgi:hypothetical protein